MNFFSKDPEQLRKERRDEEIMSKVPEEKYRKPSPLMDNVFPNHNFINFVVTQDGNPINLHVYRYPPVINEPDSEPKSIVIFFHGLNAHLGLYAHIAKELAQKNQCVVVGFDHRGFGRSQGFPGLIESDAQHFEDSEQFLELIRKYYFNLFHKVFPIFLLGQSLGGMTSYHLALSGQEWVKGTILIAPAIKDNTANAKIAKVFVKLLGGLLPRLLFVDQGHGLANKNPQISENNQNDNYIYKGKIVPGTIKIILDCMNRFSSTFAQFKTPFLVIMGGVDKLVDPDVANDLMSQSPSQDKTLIYKENMWHNVVMEEEIIEIIPEILLWIKQRS